MSENENTGIANAGEIVGAPAAVTAPRTSAASSTRFAESR